MDTQIKKMGRELVSLSVSLISNACYSAYGNDTSHKPLHSEKPLYNSDFIAAAAFPAETQCPEGTVGCCGKGVPVSSSSCNVVPVSGSSVGTTHTGVQLH